MTIILAKKKILLAKLAFSDTHYILWSDKTEDEPWFYSQQGKIFVCSSQHSGRPWDPPKLLSSVLYPVCIGVSFPWVNAIWV